MENNYRPSLPEEEFNRLTKSLSNPDLEPISPVLTEIVKQIAEELVVKYNQKFTAILEEQKQDSFRKGLEEGKRLNLS